MNKLSNYSSQYKIGEEVIVDFGSAGFFIGVITAIRFEQSKTFYSLEVSGGTRDGEDFQTWVSDINSIYITSKSEVDVPY